MKTMLQHRASQSPSQNASFIFFFYKSIQGPTQTQQHMTMLISFFFSHNRVDFFIFITTTIARRKVNKQKILLLYSNCHQFSLLYHERPPPIVQRGQPLVATTFMIKPRQSLPHVVYNAWVINEISHLITFS